MAASNRGTRSATFRFLTASSMLAAILLAIPISGYGSSWRSQSSPAALDTSSTPMRVGAVHPCGVRNHHPRVYRHVVWVVMENHSFSGIIGSGSAPYINKLAHKCGLATHFYAETHPSLPNYLAMTSGSTHGVNDDAPPSAHPIRSRSIFSQLGKHWRSLQQSMPTPCALTSVGKYAVKHNPAAYYTRIRSTCRRRDVPFSRDLSARFTFVTPNLCNDMHSCSTSTGDTWLSKWMPKVLKSRRYRSGSMAIFLTWDEGSGDQRIATLVISPYTPAGAVGKGRLSHYSMLRSTESMLGRKLLGHAKTAHGMRHPFHL